MSCTIRTDIGKMPMLHVSENPFEIDSFRFLYSVFRVAVVFGDEGVLAYAVEDGEGVEGG